MSRNNHVARLRKVAPALARSEDHKIVSIAWENAHRSSSPGTLVLRATHVHDFAEQMLNWNTPDGTRVDHRRAVLMHACCSRAAGPFHGTFVAGMASTSHIRTADGRADSLGRMNSELPSANWGY
jgi:hypothetical protein